MGDDPVDGPVQVRHPNHDGFLVGGVEPGGDEVADHLTRGGPAALGLDEQPLTVQSVRMPRELVPGAVAVLLSGAQVLLSEQVFFRSAHRRPPASDSTNALREHSGQGYGQPQAAQVRPSATGM